MNLLNCSSSEVRILKDKQVLVVDNDRDSLQLYSILLEDYGANVVTAGSIAEALESFGWLVPDVLICETHFWGEAIETLTTRLSEMEKKTANHIPAIAVTARIVARFSRFVDAGFECYFLKLVDLDALVFAIGTLLFGKLTPPMQ